MTEATVVMADSAKAGRTDRAVAGLLLGLMILGSFALWIGVPIAVLYGLSHVTDSKTQHYLLALLAVPVAMILFSRLLFWINALYLRVTGSELPVEDDDGSPRRPQGPLTQILMAALLIALVAFLGWLAFGGHHPEGGTVW